ncbi:MAG TPA: type II toxin-antitoxin system HicA family toxin [Solirubrobacterales bacterium]|nr:type II toxin-antitoxin system HicA family toxin [Solirubrobacterales bacterium]
MSARLPAVRPRQLIRVLEQKGWKLARSKGSHRHFTHPDSPNVVTVPVHARDVKRGTLSGIPADAGISRDEFLEALK